MSRRRTRGNYGVAVTPDIGLDEALRLAKEPVLMIIPCDEDALYGFRRDPRFDELLILTEKAGAQIRMFPTPARGNECSDDPIAGSPFWEGK